MPGDLGAQRGDLVAQPDDVGVGIGEVTPQLVELLFELRQPIRFRGRRH